ncbi:MAG: hypothetical protein QXI16_06425 [Sulfolobaceae archaeon]
MNNLEKWNKPKLTRGLFAFIKGKRAYVPIIERNYFSALDKRYSSFSPPQLASEFLFYADILVQRIEKSIKLYVDSVALRNNNHLVRIIYYIYYKLQTKVPNCDMTAIKMLSETHYDIVVKFCNEKYYSYKIKSAKLELYIKDVSSEKLLLLKYHNDYFRTPSKRNLNRLMTVYYLLKGGYYDSRKAN